MSKCFDRTVQEWADFFGQPAYAYFNPRMQKWMWFIVIVEYEAVAIVPRWDRKSYSRIYGTDWKVIWEMLDNLVEPYSIDGNPTIHVLPIWNDREPVVHVVYPKVSSDPPEPEPDPIPELPKEKSWKIWSWPNEEEQLEFKVGQGMEVSSMVNYKNGLMIEFDECSLGTKFFIDNVSELDESKLYDVHNAENTITFQIAYCITP